MISVQEVILGLAASCLPSLIAIALLDWSDKVVAEESIVPIAARRDHR
jgi:hypothetical protein